MTVAADDGSSERTLSIIGGELKEISREHFLIYKKEWLKKLPNCKTFEDFEAIQKACNYKKGWIHYQMKVRGLK